MAESEGASYPAEQDSEGLVRFEQVKLLFSALPLTLSLTFIIAPFLAFLLWDVIDHTVLHIWLTSILGFSLLRGWLAFAYYGASPESKYSRSWLTLLLIGTVLAAVLWGAPAIIMFAEDSVVHQAIVTLMLGGVAAGSMTSLSPMLLPAITFILITMIPLVIRFAYTGTELSISLAMLVGLFIIMMILNSIRMNRNILQNIVLRLQSQASEEALRASEERFRELFQGNRSVELIIDPADGRIIEANRAAENFYGYEREALLSMRISDINMLSEAEVAAEMRRANEEKRNHFLFKHRLANGEVCDVEVHSGPIQWNRERVLYSIVHDITARVEAEDRLRKLSQAVEQAGESVIITDKDGVIEYVNPAFSDITGYLPEEAISKTPRILKSGQQTAQFYQELWRTITSGKIWKNQMVERRKDGSLYPAVMSIAPIFDENGEITHYVGIQQDMSEHEELENKFRQAQKMEALGTLVGGIAHDFNNMLAGIGGNVYLLKNNRDVISEVEERLENIEGLTSRAATMIQQLLAFARKGHVERIPFGLTSFIKEVSRLGRTSIPENIDFQINICTDELVIRGDTTQLQQAVMNLLNNARDAVTDVEHPVISLSLNRYVADTKFKKSHDTLIGDQFALLTVEDNGVGISNTDLSHIYEPFFTTKEVGLGTGLGLSMVYGSVIGLGGAIEVESTPEEGTCFRVYLPLLDEKLPLDKGLDSEEIVDGDGELLLVCDDNNQVREMLKSVLEQLNYRVITAMDGLEAVENFKADQEQIDLVIMDVVMPRLGGVKAYERIRRIKPEAKVIFVTGYDKDAALKGEKLPEQCIVLSKPYNLSELSQLVRAQIRPNTKQDSRKTGSDSDTAAD